jgi:hypothetical protein
MSEVASRALVNVALADYAADDAAGKVNVIGKGLAVIGYDARQNISTPFVLVLDVWVPTDLLPAEFAIDVSLLDESGEIVELPTPVGSQKLRIAHVAEVKYPTGNFSNGVAKHVGGRANLTVNFNTGIPLAPNGLYTWRIELDGDEDYQWTYPFAVAGPPKAPVIG